MKIVVLSAPSGSGKTTIAHRLLENLPGMEFSISATTRQPRENERDGVDYYFLTESEFQQRIQDDAFVEWEEVYPGVLYGTLRSELERIARDRVALLDIDVKGAINVKRDYGGRALTIFVRPPSLSTLAERLQRRLTETSASLAGRLERARLEMDHADAFDAVIVNDDLETAVVETAALVRGFLAASTPADE